MAFLNKEEAKNYREVKRFLGFELSKVVVWCMILAFALGCAGWAISSQSVK